MTYTLNIHHYHLILRKIGKDVAYGIVMFIEAYPMDEPFFVNVK